MNALNSDHYTRQLQTTSGKVTLKVPKLKGVPFEKAIIERYRRREYSVKEALIEITWPVCLFGGLKILQKSYGAQKYHQAPLTI